jgi:hypothetical protein
MENEGGVGGSTHWNFETLDDSQTVPASLGPSPGQNTAVTDRTLTVEQRTNHKPKHTLGSSKMSPFGGAQKKMAL